MAASINMTARQRANRKWFQFNLMLGIVGADMALWAGIAWAGSEIFKRAGGM